MVSRYIYEALKTRMRRAGVVQTNLRQRSHGDLNERRNFYHSESQRKTDKNNVALPAAPTSYRRQSHAFHATCKVTPSSVGGAMVDRLADDPPH